MDAPSMVQRSGDTLIVRSVVSGDQLYFGQEHHHQQHHRHQSPSLSNLSNDYLAKHFPSPISHIVGIPQQDHQQDHDTSATTTGDIDETNTTNNQSASSSSANLPQCKIKRNYSCNSCTYFTQNPRHFLTHLRDIHYEKIIINECKHCLYASRHYQKLVRHMKMVHGSTDGLEEQALSRKRASQLAREQKKRKNISINPLPQQQHQQQSQSISTAIGINDFSQPHQLSLSQQSIQQQQQQQPLSLTSNSGNNHRYHHVTGSPTTSSASSIIPFTISTQHQQQNQHQEPISASPSPEFPNNKLLKCTVCDFTTLYRAQLVNHERDEHNKTKFFRCEKCSYVTHIKARFSKHVKYHSMPMIKCVMCDFRTPYKWNLDRHMKNHGGAGPYKCSACNFTADIKQSLTVHEMNHHVPPVGHASGMSMARRRNKVGGTDIADQPQFSPLNLSESDSRGSTKPTMSYGIDYTNNNNLNFESFNEPLMKKIKLEMTSNGIAAVASSSNYQTMAADLSHKPHTQTSSSVSPTSKKSSRPVPNLIPIQPTATIANAAASTSTLSTTIAPPPLIPGAMNLSMPAARNTFLETLAALTHKDMGDIYTKSFPGSSLKDMAALFMGTGAAEEIFVNAMAMRNNTSTPQLSPASNASSSTQRRKAMTFFDELKEKLSTGGGGAGFTGEAFASRNDTSTLTCQCGHLAKCLSELIIHQKSCSGQSFDDKPTNDSPVNLSTTSNSSSSTSHSIRCQYCRHRCKSSADLHAHMQQCMEGRSNDDDSMESNSMYGNSEKFDVSEDLMTGDDDDDDNNGGKETPHPMENVTFVWNKLPDGANNSNETSPEPNQHDHHHDKHDSSAASIDRSEESETNDDYKPDDNSYYGVETAPGYGEVTKKMSPGEDAGPSSLKKVFKCPHCSFWASTASRFHVHIVGHLNKKPFECSLCSYRSNWRWDITKHIRLKTIRDPSHKTARVLMNDETGRRNYTKYNKHITLMKVTDEDGDPKLLKSGEMTPSQEAALSFLNENGSDHHSSSATSAAASVTVSGGGAGPSPINEFLQQQQTFNKSLMSQSDVIDLDDAVPLSLVKYSVPEQQQADERQRSDENVMIENSLAKRDSNENQTMASDEKITDGKRTSFKCKKCNFRHPNRDVVLTHVKGHYQEAGIMLVDENRASISPALTKQQQSTDISTNNSTDNKFPLNASNLYLNGLLSKMNLPLTASQQQQVAAVNFSAAAAVAALANLQTSASSPIKLSLSPPQLNANDLTTSTATSSASSAMATAVATTSLSSTTTTVAADAAILPIPATPSEHGEMDEASSVGTSVTGWRDPAPYRCGHCHQVSNWKHVIQRHCRLKHNGDINIESIEKGTKKRVYSRLIIPGTSSPAIINSINSNNNSSQNLNDIITISDSGNTPPTPSDLQSLSSTMTNFHQTNIYPEKSPISISISSSPIIIPPPPQQQQQPSQQNQLIQLLNQKPKQYQCDHCPFMSSCKAQLESHSSIHETVTVTQNQTIDLTNTKNDDDDDDDDNADLSIIEQKPIEDNYTKAIDLRTILSTATITPLLLPRQHAIIDDKILLFCKYCPARFVSDTEMTTHLKMHASWYPYRCSACTFTSRQESCIEKHATVHTTAYVERSREFLRSGDYRAHADYPQPELASVKIDDNCNELIWIASEFRNRLSGITVTTTTSPLKQNSNPTTAECNIESVTNNLTSTISSSDNVSKEIDLDDIISASKVPNKSYNGLTNTKPVESAITSELPSVSIVQEIPSVEQNSVVPQQSKQQEPETSSIVTEQPMPIPTPSQKTTIEKQLENIQEIRRSTNLVSNVSSIPVREEKCPHCPYSTAKPDILKEHMQYHICVSGTENQINCDHCDYSVPNEHVLKEHVQLHFMLPIARKSVNYFTCYDNLVLTSCNNGGSADNINGGGIDIEERKIIFPSAAAAAVTAATSIIDAVGNSSDKENRIIIDINTGEVFK